MTDNASSPTEREIAQRMQSQFRFYIVSLIFTLLALAVQSAKIGQSNIQNILEISAWFLLLISGVLGLWYLEWEPIIRERIASRSEFDLHRKQIKQLQASGATTVPILSGGTQKLSERLAKWDEYHAAVDLEIRKNLRVANRKYDIARYCFLSSLILLISARSAPTIIGLFGYRLK